MPRLPGRREVYVSETHAGSFHIYVGLGGWLACHDFVDNFNDHLFVGLKAHEQCLAELRTKLRDHFGCTPTLKVERVDEVIEFPFPDAPERLVYARS